MLDPIVSLRQSVRLPPGGTARVAFTTGFAETEEDARRLIEKYHDRRAVARALALASTHSQIELRHLGLTVDDTIRFQRLAGRLLYGDPAAARRRRRRRRTAAASPSSGSTASPATSRSCWRDSPTAPSCRSSAICSRRTSTCARKGLAFDLVVLNEHAASYLQDLQEALHADAREQPRAGLGRQAGRRLPAPRPT